MYVNGDWDSSQRECQVGLCLGETRDVLDCPVMDADDKNELEIENQWGNRLSQV